MEPKKQQRVVGFECQIHGDVSFDVIEVKLSNQQQFFCGHCFADFLKSHEVQVCEPLVASPMKKPEPPKKEEVIEDAELVEDVN